MAEIKQSINNAQVVGTLKETNLQIITKEVTLKGGNGVEKKVTCRQVGKIEFKNPMFLVEVNGNDIGVDFFPINEKKIDDNGQIIDNPRFKSMVTVMETYVPKIKDAENATRVKIDGTLRANEYVDKNFEYKSFPYINGFQISSSNVPEDDIADCEISGIIRSITKELKSNTEEPTGRLKMELYSFDNSGVAVPYNFVVNSDLADDVLDAYANGDSVKIYYEVVTRQVGGAKKTTGGSFGRRDSHRVSGFTVTEYSIFRGDEVFDEENEYYISIADMKKAKKERDMLIEAKIREAKEKGVTTTSSPKGASTRSKEKASPFSSGETTNSPSIDDEDSPF